MDNNLNEYIKTLPPEQEKKLREDLLKINCWGYQIMGGILLGGLITFLFL